MAAGGENHSRVPCLADKVRRGAQRGPFEFVGGLDCIYRCPFTREWMGDTAENLTARFGYTREAMDDWDHRSQQLAGRAMTSGFLARQIAPIDVPDSQGGARHFEHDEFPRITITREKLASLKPAFRKDGHGQVTAGNASGVTDGTAGCRRRRRSTRGSARRGAAGHPAQPNQPLRQRHQHRPPAGRHRHPDDLTAGKCRQDTTLSPARLAPPGLARSALESPGGRRPATLAPPRQPTRRDLMRVVRVGRLATKRSFQRTPYLVHLFRLAYDRPSHGGRGHDQRRLRADPTRLVHACSTSEGLDFA